MKMFLRGFAVSLLAFIVVGWVYAGQVSAETAEAPKTASGCILNNQSKPASGRCCSGCFVGNVCKPCTSIGSVCQSNVPCCTDTVANNCGSCKCPNGGS
jgi:hypothetical protein